MDINKMIGELRAEREQVEETIMVLETSREWSRQTSRTAASLDETD
jgi:hypothetical protein